MSEPSTSQAVPEIERQKLAFEKERHAIEERGKRNAFIWSIVSTFIGSAVTIVIALIAADSKQPAPKPLPSSINSATVEQCSLSLQRLPTLAMQENQTVANLRDAINRHVTDCDQVLDEIDNYLTGTQK